MNLIRNSILNVMGYAIPSIVAIPALGYLARELGTQQFGLFTLALAIVGFSSVFDAGITRSVIREISFFRHNVEERNKIISTSIYCMVFFGGIGFLIIILLAPFSMALLNITNIDSYTIHGSIVIVGVCIPIFLFNQLFLGFMEGEEKFGIVNAQKITSNILIGILPAVFVYFHNNVIFAVLGVLIGRLIGLLLSFYLFRCYVRSENLLFDKVVFYRLFKFGGWITVSNIISPIMTVADRFILSHQIGASHVAFYTAPSEGIARLTIIPAALSRAIFPKLSFTNEQGQQKKIKHLGYSILIFTCIPVSAFVFLFADDILTVWMGEAFSETSSITILRILVIGFIFNSLAQIPFASIQANGKAQYTALIHLVEICPYIYLLIMMIRDYGLIGVAYAWVARTIVDFILLFILEKALPKKIT